MSAQAESTSSEKQESGVANPYLKYQGDSNPADSAPRHQRIQLSNDRSKEPQSVLGKRPSTAAGSAPQSSKHQQREKFHPNVYGNYKAYYSSRRDKGQKDDPRMHMLDPSLVTDKTVLDIGCNSGNLTIILAMKYKPTHVVGIDIDPNLIHSARTHLKLAYSLRNPDSEEVDLDIGFKYHYFPHSMSTMFGFLPTLPARSSPKGFPYNVEFKADDWLKTPTENETYDTIFALSITKWIHLHNGDEGMKEFFHKAYQTLKPGGTFVVEPQAYESYARRRRDSEHIKATYDSIKFLPDQFKDFLLNEVHFASYEIAGDTENEQNGTAWFVLLFG
ncbi:hypothetical protein INT44_003488 [Umbelopsis vinacea]|uniref:RNA methyltransferase n=1 Tax=Umbelopsis vinacea TaxID=44442 RepID=A0A8H7PVY8_9FUNG|nr:hypothetical protein INT44_003488 [Umbelopsis vinacea]